MNQEIKILLVASLFFRSCVPEKPSPVLVVPLEPTVTLPQTLAAPLEPTAVLPQPTAAPSNTKVLAQVEAENKVIQEPTPLPFMYYSQRNPSWANIPAHLDATVEKDGCGIMVGAMVTRTDPYTYWGYLVDYYKEHRLDPVLLPGGTDLDYHLDILKKLGFTTTPIEGSLDEIKAKIAEYTGRGVPVIISGEMHFNGTWRAHQAVAVGIDQDGNIILNDPEQGEGFSIQDRHLDNGTEDGDPVLRVFAVEKQ